jgi:hypothetical protein
MGKYKSYIFLGVTLVILLLVGYCVAKSSKEKKEEKPSSMEYSPEGDIIINISENAPVDSVSSTDEFMVGQKVDFFADIEVKSFKTGVLSLDELNTIALNVFPNPATDEVNVSFEASNADYSISLMDLQGRIVNTQSFSNLSGTQLISIETESVSKGSYIVVVSSNGVKTTKNVVIK